MIKEMITRKFPMNKKEKEKILKILISRMKKMKMKKLIQMNKPEILTQMRKHHKHLKK
jgi:hypothetical protein